MRCQCLKRGCIHDVFFLVGRRKIVLMMRRLWDEQSSSSRNPLLLQLPTPLSPITPSQVTESQPTRALKSPSRISLLVLLTDWRFSRFSIDVMPLFSMLVSGLSLKLYKSSQYSVHLLWTAAPSVRSSWSIYIKYLCEILLWLHKVTLFSIYLFIYFLAKHFQLKAGTPEYSH